MATRKKKVKVAPPKLEFRPGQICPNCLQQTVQALNEWVRPMNAFKNEYSAHENPFDCIRYLSLINQRQQDDINDLKSEVERIKNSIP